MTVYSSEFFANRRPNVARSAHVIVPLVFEFLMPTSVIDIGCGTGDFLKVFADHGVRDFLGIDGDYIDRSQLSIPHEKFQLMNLSLPFHLERIYDLAVCLEVAEHLAPACASTFIASLTSLAPIILFSAAIPFQGGEHHVNEQWPDYWISLFREHGFIVVDALRKHIWNNTLVSYWYRQNAFLFCSQQALACNPHLQRERDATGDMLSVVHPEAFLAMHTDYERQFRIPLEIKRRIRIIIGH